MFGDVVYRNGLYCEYLLAQDGYTKLVACFEVGDVKLYRIEWKEISGSDRNKAVYTLHDAMTEFRAHVQYECAYCRRPFESYHVKELSTSYFPYGLVHGDCLLKILDQRAQPTQKQEPLDPDNKIHDAILGNVAEYTE